MPNFTPTENVDKKKVFNIDEMMKDMTIVETQFLKEEEIPEEFRNLKRDD